MCGIVGLINKQNSVDIVELKSMCDRLELRGPDAEGTWINNQVGLGHRRLSIIDLETGDQPMTTDNSNIVIVFNGEIYNFLSIRKELNKEGIQFKTESDTEVILQAYQTTPSDIRGNKVTSSDSQVTILLPYKAPFDWPLMLIFFRSRKMSNIEDISTEHYFRTIELDDCRGWIKVTHHKKKNALNLTVKLTDYSYLHQIIARVRRMFDLDADMQIIHQHLMKHPKLASVIENFPGLRLPGCWDIFEFSIRAILGQQISVKGATTLAQRIAEKYGENIAELEQPADINTSKYFPKIDALMAVDYQDIGLTRSRIATLQNWVSFFKENESIFAKGLTIEELEAALTKLKGIGPWTVNYIGMRGLSDPDAFPSADLGIIKALTIDAIKPKNKDILALAETWRPWRAYAAIYLWQSLQLTTENNIKTDIKE